LLRVLSRLGGAAKPAKQANKPRTARATKSEEVDTNSRDGTTKEYKSREIIEDDDR
jgi:hypothetical protein